MRYCVGEDLFGSRTTSIDSCETNATIGLRFITYITIRSRQSFAVEHRTGDGVAPMATRKFCLR